MYWHVVRFRFPEDVDDRDRSMLEARIAELAGAIEEIRFLRVARAADEPEVTGLLSGFDDEAGYVVYRDHPLHAVVLEDVRAFVSEVTRLHVETADPSDALPRTLEGPPNA